MTFNFCQAPSKIMKFRADGNLLLVCWEVLEDGEFLRKNGRPCPRGLPVESAYLVIVQLSYQYKSEVRGAKNHNLYHQARGDTVER